MGNYCTKEVKIINLSGKFFYSKISTCKCQLDDANNEESLKKAFPNSQSTVDLFQRSIHQHSRDELRSISLICIKNFQFSFMN
jgi:hypothetical protein